MTSGIFKSLAFTALIAGALISIAPQQAQARAILNLNTTNTQQCNGYTRNYIDAYGYQRSATGTACLQPNGQWIIVSESLNPAPYPVYPQRVIYRDQPAHYTRPNYVQYDDRDDWRYDNDRYDNDRYDRWDRYDDDRHGQYNR